jgi:hypothetical protein
MRHKAQKPKEDTWQKAKRDKNPTDKINSCPGSSIVTCHSIVQSYVRFCSGYRQSLCMSLR